MRPTNSDRYRSSRLTDEFELGVDLDNKKNNGNLTFSRRYLDPNRVTYEVPIYFLLEILIFTFHTSSIPVGAVVVSTPMLASLSQRAWTSSRTNSTCRLRSVLPLMTSLSPGKDTLAFTVNCLADIVRPSAPFPSNDSLLTLFIEQAAPVALAINNTRAAIPNIMITNSGSQRFDVYSGAFTKNDQLTASPFTDAFLFLTDIPFGVARQVLPALNAAGANEKRRRWAEAERERYGRGAVDVRYNAWLEDMAHREGAVEKRAAGNLTLGYVTKDVSSFAPLSNRLALTRSLIGMPGSRGRHTTRSAAVLLHTGLHRLR